jgi:hypothetical protein
MIMAEKPWRHNAGSIASGPGSAPGGLQLVMRMTYIISEGRETVWDECICNLESC